jgi:hypothetical protein
MTGYCLERGAAFGDGGFVRLSSHDDLQMGQGAASKPGVGLKALHARPATGRPRSLTPRQERQVFRWINGRDPRQYGLDFGLWTRSVVADLIERSSSNATLTVDYQCEGHSIPPRCFGTF